MDDPGYHGTPPPGLEEPPRRPSALPWALLAIVAVAAFLAIVWLFIDRGRVLEELASAREETSELRDVFAQADERIADLEARLEEQQDEVMRRGEEIARCRRALQQISEAWNGLVEAVEAAGEFDQAEARALADRADEQRRAAERAASRCG